MRIRTLVVVAALAGAAAPVHAEPFAGRYGSTSGVVRLRGVDGRPYAVTFAVRAVVPQAGTPSYVLDIAIGSSKRYSLPLSAAQVTADDDLSDVSVRVPALGTIVTLRWTADADPSPTDIPSVGVPSSSVNVTLNGDPKPARLAATVWGATCSEPGSYASTTGVAPEGYGAGPSGPKPGSRAPAQFLRSGRRTASCAS